MSPRNSSSCENCGCCARITNLKESDDRQWEELDKMKKEVNNIPKRFNQLLLAVLLVLIGVIANLGYMVFGGVVK